MKKQPSIIPPIGENTPQIDAVEFLEMEIKDLPISDLKKEALRVSFSGAYITALPLIQSAMQFVITDESTQEDTKLAAEKYKQLNEVAKQVEATRKEVKDEALREGQAIDAIGRKLKDMFAPALEHLKLQKDYLKLKKEREQAELRAARTTEMQPYANFCNMYADFGLMGVTEFETVKAQAVAAKEAHEKAEALRIDNERLAKEKADLERAELARLQAIERDRIAREAKIAAEAAALARAEAMKEAAAKAELVRIENERLAAERQAAARIEAERLAAKAALNPPIAPPPVNTPRNFPTAPTSETPVFDLFAEFIKQLEGLTYPTGLQGTQAHKVAQVEAQMKQIINWLKS